MILKQFKFVALMAVYILTFYSGTATAAAISSTASGNWNNVATWVGGVVPGVGDDATIAAFHTVTINAAASVISLTTVPNGSILFVGSNTLTVGAGGIQNGGFFDATNAGAITSAATNALTHGVYNLGTGNFVMGSGTLTTSATGGVGIDNDGNFTSGTGLITTDVFRNGFTAAGASFIVGTGGLLSSSILITVLSP